MHVFETMQTLFEDVLIVTHQPVDFESFDGTVVSDIVGGAGALLAKSIKNPRGRHDSASFTR